jgi:chaperone modulatory protein CbpM
MKKTVATAAASVMDESLELTLQQFCRYSDLESEQIVEMVAEGIIEPSGTRPAEWLFNGYMLKRVQIAVRLQRDLEINLPGVAVILELLNELEQLRQKSEG